MKNKKGLTLVEVVIALAVFMIAVVMAYPIITRAGIMNIHSQNKMDVQETGSYIAENLSNVAIKQANYEELGLRLENFGVCFREESPCPDSDDVGSFMHVTGTFDYKTTNDLGHEILISLNEDDSLAKIVIEFKDTKHEIVEWLNYDN